MSHRLLFLPSLLLLAVAALFGQGLETTASPDDWEEINFEFDSDILSDGYPSLLRLADLLQKNANYRVQLIGHTDFRGSDQYNVDLGRRRAETVRDFLLKYGASANQITIETEGEEIPKVGNETDEGRFMNRRVAMEVRDGEGNLVSAGGVGEAIDGLEQVLQAQEECCNQILEKLAKLDEILDLLNDLKDENDRLRADVDALKDRPTEMPEPAPTTEEIAEVVDASLDKRRGKKYGSLNVNVGPATYDGSFSATAQGRAFVPFGGNNAVQAQGEYLRYTGRDEGQMDLGLVSRWGPVQVGGFSSFKYVKWEEWQKVAALGQGAFTLDYIFNRGRVGFFGTKAILDGAVVNSEVLARNIMRETYLRVVDQAGFSTAIAAWPVGSGRNAWFEGNIGALFRRGGSNETGGMIRYVHPLTSGLALTLEGGLNETLVTSENDGRFVVGLQFGNWLSPKNYNDQGDRPVPVDVPRIRYEVLTRDLRTGNDSPVADAGPDRMDVEPGPITLDGSASFDPDGDPITFEWVQTAGPPVELSDASSQSPTFTVAESEVYHFRLTVRDDQGGAGTDRVTVTGRRPEAEPELRIRRFLVTPNQTLPGETVTLTWDVENAESVEITPLVGSVDPVGSSTVTVQETTTFQITARRGEQEVSEADTVIVTQQPTAGMPLVLSFSANPQTISRGETSVLEWSTENAEQVAIDVVDGPGGALGSVGTSGTATVSPSDTTTYRITATNENGEINRTATVTVGQPGMPQILRFLATPQEIDPGGTSTLVWEVANADEVMISDGVGAVGLSGTTDVSPAGTTSYTLTARNDQGEVSATAQVTVRSQVRIISFTTNKSRVANPGDPAVLSWETENATRVILLPDLGTVDPTGSMTVNPIGATTYTLIAYGQSGQVQATVDIGIENENRSPVAVAKAPTVILVPAGTETGRGTLDGSDSSDPDGDPITYQWRSLGPLNATVRNPTAQMPTVEFLGGFGQYNFELMVTDDKGAMGFDTVRVFWVDP